jgi:hypothetical protein
MLCSIISLVIIILMNVINYHNKKHVTEETGRNYFEIRTV